MDSRWFHEESYVRNVGRFKFRIEKDKRDDTWKGTIYTSNHAAYIRIAQVKGCDTPEEAQQKLLEQFLNLCDEWAEEGRKLFAGSDNQSTNRLLTVTADFILNYLQRHWVPMSVIISSVPQKQQGDDVGTLTFRMVQGKNPDKLLEHDNYSEVYPFGTSFAEMFSEFVDYEEGQNYPVMD